MHRSLLRGVVGALALALLLAACGGDDSSATSTTAASGGGTHSALTVHAEADQFKFDKTAYTAKAGTVDITYVNDGSDDHTLVIKDVKGFKLTIGGEDEGSVDLDAGTYKLYCDLPGHEAAGMEATLRVS